jgi:hypothetical protein
MGYETEYLPEKGIVRVKIEGKLNFSTVRNYSTESTKLARINRCDKFLIEHTGDNQKSETYHIHADKSELEQFGFKKTDRIAIVIFQSKKNQQLMETTVYDAGWKNVKYFKNTEEAIDWLIGDK